MSLFFLYHPSSVQWLPAPDQLYRDGARKKKKKKELEDRQKKDEEELLLLDSLGVFDEET